jgi:hypothetical protein
VIDGLNTATREKPVTAVSENRVKPRIEDSSSIERVQRPMGVEERVLHGILRVGPIPDDGDCMSKRAALVAFHERPERVRFAFEAPLNRRGVIHPSTLDRRHGRGLFRAPRHSTRLRLA